MVVGAGVSTGPRSNSFHFVPVRDVDRAPGAPCPLVDNAALRQVPSRARTLWLRLPGRMRLFETSSSDFSDAELGEIKHGVGQIYLDVSSKNRFDDFAKDLKRLKLATECEICDLASECAGAYAKGPSADFAQEETALGEILQGLRGAVLDYGCGHAPYAELLAAAAVEGAVQYYGVEPDASARERLLQRRPWALLSERVPEAPRSFDHVLLLRSINHLPDPAGTIADLLPRLKSSGTLLIVDNVAFGVVRSVEQARRAEHSSAAFEHFANASAEDIHARLSELPLRLLSRQDVTRSTANQWLLHYAKL